MNLEEYANRFWKDLRRPYYRSDYQTKAMFNNMPLVNGKNEHFEQLRPYLNTSLYRVNIRGRGARQQELSNVNGLLWDFYSKGRNANYQQHLPLVLAERAAVYIETKEYRPYNVSLITHRELVEYTKQVARDVINFDKLEKLKFLHL